MMKRRIPGILMLACAALLCTTAALAEPHFTGAFDAARNRGTISAAETNGGEAWLASYHPRTGQMLSVKQGGEDFALSGSDQVLKAMLLDADSRPMSDSYSVLSVNQPNASYSGGAYDAICVTARAGAGGVTLDSVRVDDRFVLMGGTVTLNGENDLYGVMELPSGARLVINGTLAIHAGAAVINEGEVVNRGNLTNDGAFTNNGTVRNADGGTTRGVPGVPDAADEDDSELLAQARAMGLFTYSGEPERLDAVVTRLDVLDYLIAASGWEVTPTSETVFTDCADLSDLQKGVINAAVGGWVVSPGTTFAPDQECTRGQVVTFLYRLSSFFMQYDNGGTNPFSDVVEAYYYDAVVWAYANQIIESGDGRFYPDAGCTHADLLSMLVEFQSQLEELVAQARALGLLIYSGEPKQLDSIVTRLDIVDYLIAAAGWEVTPTSTSVFADCANLSDLQKGVINTAFFRGVTLGTSETTFSPEQTCTRGQVVTVLYRFYYFYHNSDSSNVRNMVNPFSDVMDGAYYYDGIVWAYANHIVGRSVEGRFYPDAGCTRADFLSMLVKLKALL